MPIYKARLSQDAGGAWIAAAVQLPSCWSRGATRDEALAKLRDEIRYRIEYCPCSGVDDEYVRVEVELAGGTGQREPAPRAWAAARQSVPAPLTAVAGCPAGSSRPLPPPGAAPAAPIAPAAPLRRGWRRWDD